MTLLGDLLVNEDSKFELSKNQVVNTSSDKTPIVPSYNGCFQTKTTAAHHKLTRISVISILLEAKNVSIYLNTLLTE